MRIVFYFFFAALIMSCGNGEFSKTAPAAKRPHSMAVLKTGIAVDAVDIPQTPVENQFIAGFCWAYTIAGLIESDVKFRTSNSLQLSEEALGYYRMLEGIYYWMQNLKGQELNTAIGTDTFQGWVLKSTEMPDSFALVKKYGVLPESVWTKKFKDEVELEKMLKVVRENAAQLIRENFDPTVITLEMIEKRVLLAPGAWSSAPSQNFIVDGKAHTPVSYLKSLDFDPDKFSSVVTNKPEDLDAVIAAAKRALVRGFSVPFGFPVNMDLLKGDTFSGKGQDLRYPSKFFKDGGHAVLIDDFVNEGSSEGALPFATLALEFLRPSKDLSYFVFKNSWGVDSATSSGFAMQGSATGYYKIDQLYLQGSANLTNKPAFSGILEVVVPNDIALDPFGKETVNPKVAE